MLTIELIKPNDVLDSFEAASITDDSLDVFIEKANKILKQQYCKAEVKRFEPQDTTAIYIANEEALNSKSMQNLSQSSNPFAAALGHFKKQEEVLPTLCFNQQNELVAKLLMIKDPELFEALINVLYVQALMLGGYTINKQEMDIFNHALYQFVILGMTNFLPEF